MWRCVDLVWTDVSEECIAFIFRVEKSALSLQPPADTGSSLADFSTLKMEVIRSSEMSVHTRSTRCHIPEDDILHSHHHENLNLTICILQLFWRRKCRLWKKWRRRNFHVIRKTIIPSRFNKSWKYKHSLLYFKEQVERHR
jgi:hypothetical protein